MGMSLRSGTVHFFNLHKYFSLFFTTVVVLVFFSHFDHVLAEVVVCAVGWVVTLPAMEMTAQATALLVLVASTSSAEEKKPAHNAC